MSRSVPFELTDRGVLLTVRLTPRGATDAVDGSVRLANGEIVLKARVRSIPEGNQANKDLIKLLAKKLSQPRGKLSLARGHKSRIKKILIEGNRKEIADNIAAIL